MADQIEETDVAIIGGGPSGTMLSALLSQKHNIPNVVLEREAAIPADPRAFSMAEYGIRFLQMVGLYDQIYSNIGSPTTWIRFWSSRTKDINQTPFLNVRIGQNGKTGHTRNLMFSQPLMEQHLRNQVKSARVGEYRDCSEVIGIEEKPEFVEVLYKRDGVERRIRAKLVIGTDGKHGFVRKKYLEPKGVLMEHVHSFQKTYIGANWDITAPTPKTHPDFPLWAKGYTPDDVLQAFTPDHFCYICNPDRRGVFSRAGPWRGSDDLLWRTEFEIFPGEDPDEMEKSKNFDSIVMPYMTHKGSYYGLSEDVTFPADCMKMRRTWHYIFESRTCNHWRIGRVLLAGDAAHVFPPYGGQGVTAGFFDVVGLSWRLAVALNPSNRLKSPAELSDLLDGWTLERKSQIKQSLAWTMKLGEVFEESSPVKIFMRDWWLWFLQLIPPIREKIQNEEVGAPSYTYEKGMAFLPDMRGGKGFSQAYCTKLTSPDVLFTDDVIFASEKRSLFQLVVLADSLDDAQLSSGELKKVQITSAATKDVLQEATYIVLDIQATESNQHKVSGKNVVRVATAAEFERSSLCRDRKIGPIGYDPLLLRSEHEGQKYVLLRPDFMIFAACANTQELSVALEGMNRILNCEVA